ncbi:MAG: hypothetical protein JWN66_3183 [Sphingomonas bacterium]|nr:hypothetical protein [Sphingomonas bacterium]
MGGGEDYLDDFAEYFRTLSQMEKENLQAQNPEPFNWTGFYVSLLK